MNKIHISNQSQMLLFYNNGTELVDYCEVYCYHYHENILHVIEW